MPPWRSQREVSPKMVSWRNPAGAGRFPGGELQFLKCREFCFGEEAAMEHTPMLALINCNQFASQKLFGLKEIL